MRYIEGGFISWDALDKYTYVPKRDIDTIIYFTQFGMEELHLSYMEDILSVLNGRKKPYELIIKVHPRENGTLYYAFAKKHTFVRTLEEDDDIYELISNASYCFSIFSTISIEAKHILTHSYFINYQHQDFSLVDYDKIGLDLIRDKGMIQRIFDGDFTPVDQTKFIKKNNVCYPHTLAKLGEVLNHEN